MNHHVMIRTQYNEIALRVVIMIMVYMMNLYHLVEAAE
jgi:hypothetical protein